MASLVICAHSAAVGTSVVKEYIYKPRIHRLMEIDRHSEEQKNNNVG